jgi:hypothetical protein
VAFLQRNPSFRHCRTLFGTLAARRTGGEAKAEASLTYRMYAMVSKVLREGFAEYFARQVMDANSGFGPQLALEYEEVTRLVQTLGEQSVRDAYFKRDAREIKKLMAAVDKYKVTNPDLLIP